MSTIRCYVPVLGADLAVLAEERRLPGPRTGFGVTAAIRAADPTADDEAWEYAAVQQAAKHLLDSGQPVLLAAVDVVSLSESAPPTGTGVPAEVVADEVALPRVAAFLLGDDVVAGEADTSGPVDLSWYDTTELPEVRRLAHRAESSC